MCGTVLQAGVQEKSARYKKGNLFFPLALHLLKVINKIWKSKNNPKLGQQQLGIFLSAIYRKLIRATRDDIHLAVTSCALGKVLSPGITIRTQLHGSHLISPYT